jgi:hypothetical protein
MRSTLTAVSFPVKIVLRLAMTLQIHPVLFSRRTVREWYVIICNVVEKVEFLLLEHQGGCNAVHWSITPTFIKETAGMIEMVKVVLILL